MRSLLLFCLSLLIHIHNCVARNDETFRQQVLAQHNIFRKEQCAAPLQRNTTLDNIAQAWADDLAKNGKFVHSNTIEHGENSFQQIPFDFKQNNGATPVSTWYLEKSNYTLTTPEKALHFTQVVWKNTKMIGVGIADIPNGGLIVVANYYPRGNYENQFAQNVGC